MSNRYVFSLSFKLAVLIAIFAFSGETVLAQNKVHVISDRDNGLYESPTGALSNGVGQYVFVGRNTAGDFRRGLMHFSVDAAIPAGATITSVSLQLYMSRTNSGPQTINLHQAFADWGEGTSDASSEEGSGAPSTPGDATWIHTFFDTQFWSSVGGDFNPGSSGNHVVDQEGFYTFASSPGMVSDVQSWLDFPSSNFGWFLIGNEASPATFKRFNTKDNPDPSTHPVLTITYTLPPSFNAILYSAYGFGDDLYTVDPTTGGSLGSVTLVVPGNCCFGMMGLATDPITHRLYAIIGNQGGEAPPLGGRAIIEVDPVAATGDSVMSTGDNFNGLAFANDGTLYGMTGHGGAIKETLFKIDLVAKDTTVIMLLDNGSGGESIAFNRDDGLLYHISGGGQPAEGPGGGAEFEAVDVGNKTRTPVPLTGDPVGGASSLVYAGNGIFYHGDFEYHEIKSSGAATSLGFLSHTSKGMAFVPIAPKQPQGLTATEGVGVIDLVWSQNQEWEMDKYDIYRNTVNDPAGATNIGTVNHPTNSFTDNTAVPGIFYFYWVMASDLQGDGSLLSASSFASINTPPVWSLPATVSFAEDGNTNLPLDSFLADDRDDPSVIGIASSGGTNVMVSIDPGTHVATFTATADWNGMESIVFSATDLDGGIAQDTVDVDVTPVNDAPVLSGIPDVMFDEDDNFDLPLNPYVSDVDNDTNAITFTANVISSTFELATLFITIDPGTHIANFSTDADSFGVFTVEFTASDPEPLSDKDTMTVTITSINDGPVRTAQIGDQIEDEDFARTFVAVLTSFFTDPDFDPLTFTATNLSAGVTPSISNDSLYISSDLNFNGSVDVRVVADDGSLSAADTFNVQVNAVNDPPTVSSPIVDQNLNEEFPKTFVRLLTNVFADIESDPLSFTSSGLGAGVNPSISNDSLYIRSTPDFVGVVDIRVVADDGSATVADTFSVTVDNVNDQPVVSNAIADVNVAEDFAKTFVADLNTVFSDVDGDALNYTATPLSAGVTTQISNDSLYLRSEANFNGSVNIDVTASDPSAAAVTDQFSVNVASVNDLPTAFGLISLTNGALTGDPTPDFLWESSSDADGDDLIYTLEISASTDFSTPDGSESGADTAVTLSQALASGTWFWRVVADDGNDGSVASTDTNSFLLDATPPDLVAGVLLSTVIPSALSVYVASDEPISEDGISATMTLKDDGGNVVDTATELFVQLSNHDEVYNATYRIPATAPISSGTLEIDVTGADVLGNTTILSRVFVIGSVAKQSAFVLKGFDGQIELSGARGAVEENGYVLVSRNETAQLPDNLRAAIDEDQEMTPVKWTAVGSTLEVIGTVPLAKPLNLTVEYTAGDIAELSSVSEFDERKIGLYEQEGTAWVYAGGEGASYRLTGKIHQFGKSSLYYNPDHEFLPQKISLDQNYPNPFNPVTTIRYGVPEESKVKLVIYNILGQQVKVLVRDNRRAGYHQVIWDGRNELGVQVSSGVYIYRIQHASGVVARKMLFVK